MHLQSPLQAPPTPLRARAIDADQTSTAPLNCDLVWHSLIGGTQEIVESFAAGDRYYLVLVERDESHRLDERSRDILERTLLLGQSQKAVAVDLQLAVSTVATHCRQGLRFMGLPCSHSRTPALLVMIGATVGSGRTLHQGRSGTFSLAQRNYRVVAAAASEGGIRGSLSIAEEQVVRLLLNGWTHAEIAAERGTSRRTVANQLAAAFRRLGVSGRLQILLLLSSNQPGVQRPRQHQSDASLRSASQRMNLPVGFQCDSRSATHV